MKKIYWKLRILFLALRRIPQINLGDEVKYRGRKYIVCNGVRSGSWRLNKLANGDDGWVSRKECKKNWTLRNIANSFRTGWRFYMTNWFSIWCNHGIKDWMRECNIWPWPQSRGGKN